MFRFWASSTCLFSIRVCSYRLSRATPSTFLVAWLAHTYHFVFSLCIQSPFSRFTCFTYTHFLVWTCLILFRFWALSIYLFPNPACPHKGSAEPLTNTFCFGLHTLSIFHQFIYYMLFTCFVPMFHSFAIFPPQWAPTSPAEQQWTTTQKARPYYLDLHRATSVPICLLAHIHVCFTLPHKIHTIKFRLHPHVTSTEVMKHLHILEWHQDFRANPTEGCQSVDHSTLQHLPHSSPHINL